jgi:hypothetical protein
VGVIYKLKTEVRDFILVQAHQRPELGCRKLSGLVKENFGVSVSKSSIHAVINGAGLSRPVGRRRKASHGQIPDGEVGRMSKPRKKKPLSSSILPPPLALTIDPPHAQQVVLQESVPCEPLLPAVGVTPLIDAQAPVPELLPEPAAAAESLVVTSPPAPESPPAIPETITVTSPSAPEMVEVRLERLPLPSASLYAGLWFLKAADHALGGIAYIASRMSACGIAGSQDDLAAVVEALAFAQLWQPEDGARVSGLYREILAGLSQKSSSEERVEACVQRLSQCGFADEERKAAGELSARVRGIECVCADGSLFFIDASRQSIWREFVNIPAHCAQPLHSVRRWAEGVFLKGEMLAVHAHPGFSAQGKQCFYDFTRAAAGDAQKRILRIEFCSQEGRHICQPLLLEPGTHVNPSQESPGISRSCGPGCFTYIVGVWPGQFAEPLPQSLRAEQVLYSTPLLEGACGLIDTVSGALGVPVIDAAYRSIVLTGGEDALVTCLTNVEHHMLRANDGISAYLSKWPNLSIGQDDFLNKINLSEAKSGYGMALDAESAGVTTYRFLREYVNILNEYCKCHFFPPAYISLNAKSMKDLFYNLTGQFVVQNGHFIVKINVRTNLIYEDDLVYACQRANEAGVGIPELGHLVFSLHTVQ